MAETPLLAQLRAKATMHSNANEDTQIEIEKATSKEMLQTYFGTPEFRIILDDNQPSISDPESGKALPSANIVLHRIDFIALPSTGHSYKVHTLHLYVHAGPPHTASLMASRLEFLVRQRDSCGDLTASGGVFAILQWGTKIMFLSTARAILGTCVLMIKESGLARLHSGERKSAW